MSDVNRLPLAWNYVKRGQAAGRWGGHGVWQVRRFCQEDWVFHIRVYRYTRTRYEIALFLAEDHWKWKKDTGVMGGLVFALSEAYHRTGKMEIHFIGLPDGHEPVVPESIRRVAAALGVTISPNRTMITDAEGRKLYARLTGLCAETEKTLTHRGISLARACFVVNRGIWSPEQVEFLAREAYAAERLFDGGIAPENRLCYQHDVLVLRIALVAERVKTLIESSAGSAAAVHTTWSSTTTQDYIVGRDVTVPTVDGSEFHIQNNEPITVGLTPRDSEGYADHTATDLHTIARLPRQALLAVTQDFSWMPRRTYRRTVRRAARCGVGIVPIVDTLAEVDEEVVRRLAQAASTKRPVPERPD